jgi:CHAT domain-containing protein
VGDILALGRESPCQLAFLSACQAGVAGGKSAYIDEYGGLPTALRLGGVASVVSSLWEVDEGFTALYTDLFYARLPSAHADPVTVVRQVGRDLREARKPVVLRRLGPARRPGPCLQSANRAGAGGLPGQDRGGTRRLYLRPPLGMGVVLRKRRRRPQPRRTSRTERRMA